MFQAFGAVGGGRDPVPPPRRVAKGFLAQRGDLTPEQAFTALRGYARAHQQKISDLAGQVITRQLDPARVLAHSRTHAAGPGAAGSSS